MGDAAERMAVVPADELRKLADLLASLEVDLADDYVAGIANRVLRDLARRWADTVSVWAVEAELWEPGRQSAPPLPSLQDLSAGQLAEVVRQAAVRLAALEGRSPAEVAADIARTFEAGPL